jgi:hypothetical protein
MFPLKSRRSKRSTSSRLGGYDSVAVRLARPEDEASIHRVASLDGKKAPQGRVLVAEADREVIAALAIDSGAVVADPFRWTSDVIALMEMRAEQLAASDLVPLPASGGAVRTALRTQLT